jgi:hypothetical protein
MKTLLVCFATLALALGGQSLKAQSDDFNDGNDNGWTRYDPLGTVVPGFAKYQVTNGAYRISVPASPNTAFGPARAGALRTEVTYSNFFVSVDLIDWNETVNQAFGIIARVKEPGLGSTDGFAMTYDFGGQDIDITWFTDERTSTGFGGGIGSGPDKITNFVHGKVYRFEFVGKGDLLKARVYRLPDNINPIASISGTAVGTPATYVSGLAGLLVYDNTSAMTGIADATFDNYIALDYEPARPRIDIGAFDFHIWWPIEFSDFALEMTRDLGSQNWTEVAVSQDATSFYYDTDRFDEQPAFFRLVHRPTP